MRAVNLLPRDEPTRSFEAKRGLVFLGGGGTALVTVALATLAIGAGATATQQRQALDGINAELAAVPKPEGGNESPEDDTALVTEKTARISALSTVLSGRIAWDEVLRQISQVLPEDVWLSSLTTGTEVGGGTSKVTLTGSTYSQDGVARFLSRLAILPALADVQLQTSSTGSTGTAGTVQFVIVAEIKTATAGASS